VEVVVVVLPTAQAEMEALAQMVAAQAAAAAGAAKVVMLSL
jgi:hypothetical protein